jgi:hypothetical protein
MENSDLPTSMSLYDALRIRFELKQDAANGVKEPRHAGTYEAFLATLLLAEEFEKTEKAQVILCEIKRDFAKT